MGFTEKDIEQMIDYYTSVGVFKLDKQESLATMRKWYNGYKFSTRAKSRMFNTDMVLHFMKEAYDADFQPRNLIDDNTKTDYNKFRHFTTINTIAGMHLNGNFTVLEKIMNDGYIGLPE